MDADGPTLTEHDLAIAEDRARLGRPLHWILVRKLVAHCRATLGAAAVPPANPPPGPIAGRLGRRPDEP